MQCIASSAASGLPPFAVLESKPDYDVESSINPQDIYTYSNNPKVIKFANWSNISTILFDNIPNWTISLDTVRPTNKTKAIFKTEKEGTKTLYLRKNGSNITSVFATISSTLVDSYNNNDGYGKKGFWYYEDITYTIDNTFKNNVQAYITTSNAFSNGYHLFFKYNNTNNINNNKTHESIVVKYGSNISYYLHFPL